VEHELTRINKDFEINFIRKVISDLSPIFEINLNDFYSQNDGEASQVMKHFLKVVSQRVGILKDKI